MNLFEKSKKLDDGRVAVGKLVGRAIKAEDEIPPLIKSRLPTVGIGLGGNRRKGRAHCELGCKTRKMNWRGQRERTWTETWTLQERPIYMRKENLLWRCRVG